MEFSESPGAYSIAFCKVSLYNEENESNLQQICSGYEKALIKQQLAGGML